MRRYQYRRELARSNDAIELCNEMDRAGWDLVCAETLTRDTERLWFRRARNHVAAMVDELTRESAPAAAAAIPEGVTVH